MIRKIFHTLAIALCITAVSSPAFAHHGTAAYDMTKTITMKGKISKFEFINPHCQIYFDATNEKGVGEQWQAELTSPNHLMRTGWNKDTLKPGDDVTITGYRTKIGSNAIWIAKILLKNEELKMEPGN
jgi:hypothetical protein